MTEPREHLASDNLKQQAGLHDDELLVGSYPFEFVLGVLREDLPEVDDGRRWAVAERLVAAVRGAGPSGGVDSLASARGFLYRHRDCGWEAHAQWKRTIGAWDLVCPTCGPLRGEDVEVVQPVAPSDASSNPSGAVPLEPQEEKLTREEAEEIVGAIDFLLRYSDGLDLTDYQGRILAKLRVFSAVPLLQDGEQNDG